MKALFIGGTGTISSAVSELAIQNGVELTLLTRSGKGPEGPPERSFNCSAIYSPICTHAWSPVTTVAILRWNCPSAYWEPVVSSCFALFLTQQN